MFTPSTSVKLPYSSTPTLTAMLAPNISTSTNISSNATSKSTCINQSFVSDFSISPKKNSQNLISTVPSSPNLHVLNKEKLAELVKEVDPQEELSEDVEEILLQLADDFVDNIIENSCKLAKHRKSSTLQLSDVQFHLQHNWKMNIPGYTNRFIKKPSKPPSLDAHKQRVSLIKKALKRS